MDVSELKKCDIKKPYIFISYSSKDAEVVWTDVKEFQRRGYNVWLDECNLDKTKKSWKDDAIEAIKKTKCKFLVFYVSRHSLESKPCLNEMLTIKDEQTKLFHGEKELPFIAVDVEEIGDITTFKKGIMQNLIDSELEENDIQNRLLVINEFIKVFFNNSNERVRVKPKCDSARAKEYYTDIIEFFPKETRIYEEESVKTGRLEEAVVEKVTQAENTLQEEETVLDSIAPQEVFFMKAKAVIDDATGYYILKKGSFVATKTADSCPEVAKRLREESIQKGELVAAGMDYQLTIDKVFKTASGAATYVSGYSISGNVAWKPVATNGIKKSLGADTKLSESSASRASKGTLPDMIQEGKISVGAQLYVKDHVNEIGILNAEGKIVYQGNVMSLNQFVPLILGPGSRNAYLYVYEKESGLALSELRDGADISKKVTDICETMQSMEPSILDSTITIGDIRKKLSDRNTAFALRQVREGMPRGGKGAMDYAMAAILGGCNSVNVNSPVYQINYYTYAVADFEKKKEDGGLGATWTWSSNCRKVLGLEKAGQIPTEIDGYFKSLSENTSLSEIEEAFLAKHPEAFQTQKNDMVVYALKKIYEFFLK